MVQLLIKQYVKSKSSDIDKKIKFPTKKAWDTVGCIQSPKDVII